MVSFLNIFFKQVTRDYNATFSKFANVLVRARDAKYIDVIFRCMKSKLKSFYVNMQTVILPWSQPLLLLNGIRSFQFLVVSRFSVNVLLYIVNTLCGQVFTVKIVHSTKIQNFEISSCLNDKQGFLQYLWNWNR